MPTTATITGSRSNRPDSGATTTLMVNATTDGETTKHGPFAYYADAYDYALWATGDAAAITRDGKRARAAKRRT
jgi:hypothetical protein